MFTIICWTRTLTSSDQLMKDVRVEFEGEEVIHAGALKLHYFELLMQKIDENLFTGLPTRRIPKMNKKCI